MTDGEIIALWHGGQREKAFKELVAAYSEKLYWHVRHLVFNHEDTDDLLQEIFVKIWTALPSYRGEARLYTWIYRIATNEALGFIRRQRVRAALRFQPLDEEVSRRISDDPYFNGDAAERSLLRELSKLPERQRTVFSMRWFDEMPYEEIAEVLGVSTGSLKATYHIAAEKLKEKLKTEF